MNSWEPLLAGVVIGSAITAPMDGHYLSAIWLAGVSVAWLVRRLLPEIKGAR